jgi:glycosyltransferase involved in cell wall biosynthesis
MRILLLGEYSNVHWTLAEGLRALGHEVCVASNGDFWKNYKRDISLVRHKGPFGGARLLLKTLLTLPKLRGYYVVQIINPMFLELTAQRIEPIYRYLRRNNKKVFLGAFGMDRYWVEGCTATPPIFRYSDFNIGDTPIDNDYTREQKADWTNTPKAALNTLIANDCNGIIAGLYEYYAVYREHFPQKLTYIPFPVAAGEEQPTYNSNRKIRFFIGINRERSIYKGTDIMLRALERIARDYPDDCEITIAESVPFAEYQRMIDSSDILLDQLYGYSPAMNALLAMSKGKIVVGGGEEEYYALLGEKTLRPIVNTLPNEEDVYKKLKNIIARKNEIARMQRHSRELITRYHTPEKVAQEYIRFWNSK